MGRSLIWAVAVAAVGMLVIADSADAGRRCGRRHGGGCGGYSHGCGGGGCGGYSYGGCGGYTGCGGGGCEGGVHYDGQPIPAGGNAPPPPPGGDSPSNAPSPPPQASVERSTIITSAPTYTPTYRSTSARRGLFGRR